MSLRVLIIEDELQSRKSHHFQYLQGLINHLRNEGGQVSLLCNRAASAEVSDELNAEPLLDGISSAMVQQISNPLVRKLSVISGIIRNAFIVIRRLGGSHQDFVIVPTAWFQHVLLLLPVLLLRAKKINRVCLIFVQCGSTSERSRRKLKWLNKLLAILQQIHPEVRFYAETNAAKEILENSSSLRFRIIPHAVTIPTLQQVSSNESKCKPVVFGFYGFARYEQGADILLNAIRNIVNKHPHLNIRFNIVWPNGFWTPNGEWVDPDSNIEQSGKVVIYRTQLNGAAYQEIFSRTDWIMLPYRTTSYFGRISRVSIEACCLGIPGIYTRGTSQEDIFTHYGAGIGIPESDVDALERAIIIAYNEITDFRKLAQGKRHFAINAFSPMAFWRAILD